MSKKETTFITRPLPPNIVDTAADGLYIAGDKGMIDVEDMDDIKIYVNKIVADPNGVQTAVSFLLESSIDGVNFGPIATLTEVAWTQGKANLAVETLFRANTNFKRVAKYIRATAVTVAGTDKFSVVVTGLRRPGYAS